MIGLDLGEGVLAEVQAVRESVGLWRAEALSLVAVSGPDAETFLHNQTTNDVRSLRPGAGQASATLDSKAHLVATFTLHRTEDTFLLLVDRCREEALLAQIEKYHVTEEIRVEVRGDRVRFLLVQGPHSPALLRAAWPDLGLPEAEQDLVPFPERPGSSCYSIRIGSNPWRGHCVRLGRSSDCGRSVHRRRRFSGSRRASRDGISI